MLLPGVGEADHSDASLDDIVSQSDDERVGLLFLESGAVTFQGFSKHNQVAILHSCKERHTVLALTHVIILFVNQNLYITYM